VDTGIIKRSSQAPQPECEFEDATSQSWTRDQESTAAFVAMLACNVILLLMLFA
jgi:hypothetical protein